MKKNLSVKLSIMSLVVGLASTGCVSNIPTQINNAKDGFEKLVGAKKYISDKPVLMFVLDGSGSMNQTDLQGAIKMYSAKKTISDIVGQLDKQKVNVGLIAFNQGCYSTKLLVEPDNNDFSKVVKITNTINPSGTTPLAKAIKEAGSVLKDIDKKVRIIVISDGAETCNGNPKAEAKYLVDTYGIDVKIFVVGYGVDIQTKRQLESVASAGNGKYFAAQNSQALNQVVNEIIAMENIRLDNFSLNGSIYTIHINFDTGSSKIKPDFLNDIIEFANYLSLNDYKVQIQGHTDSKSSKEYNKKLSLSRAKSVVEELKKLGISSDRLSYVGFGEDRPIASNKIANGRYENRRVEAHIIK